MNFLSALLSLNSPARPRAPRNLARLIATAAAVAIFATACGGGTAEIGTDSGSGVDIDDRPTVPAEEPTAIPAQEPTAIPVEEPASGAVNSVEGVSDATVKIVAQGTFVAPLELNQTTATGLGTGFVIDESGLMVTNNHVVTGAGIVEVFFDGSEEPVNARLLGVSECSDLAVLDIDGEGYPFLDFRESMEGVNPGLPVFAAGYPGIFDLDPSTVDYTLTAGIVSTTQASGETPWASVDGVIEHDARIRGGNSGGPLVDEQGRVVGINYAGDDVNDLNEAIDAASARQTIEALQLGDVESLGINGRALVLEDASGVWVSSVASGTPADQAGILPGDLITQMESLPLATDGTMMTYCDIIRTNGPGDTLSIEVVRLGSEEILTGQINGTPLTQSFSFATELSEEMSGDSTTISAGYDSYEFVSDDTNNVGVDVPTAWVDRNGAVNENFGESIYAAPELAGFTEGWLVPGVIVERSTNLTSADIDSVLDTWADLDCADRSGREDFATEDGFFSGKWEVFTECGGTDTAALTIAVSPPDGNSVVRMFFQIVTEADLEAADRAIASFDAVS